MSVLIEPTESGVVFIVTCFFFFFEPSGPAVFFFFSGVLSLSLVDFYVQQSNVCIYVQKFTICYWFVSLLEL